MTIEEDIDNIRDRLKKGSFKSETAVRQGIVNRLLRSLAWPTEDTEVVYPEYPVGGGKVDYALCHPSNKPRVFIEAKQVGNIEGAEEQLFGYDSRIRVSIAVLTDGQIWRFFHPTGEGTWKQRKVYDLDLITGNSNEMAECFNRYLHYEAIRSGNALEAIRGDYDNLVKQRKIEEGLPEAWHTLLHESDQRLTQVIAEMTENLCGHRPSTEQVIAFLRMEELPPIRNDENSDVEQSSTSKSRRNKPSTRLRVKINNDVIERQHAKDTFIEVIEKLGLEKVMEAHPSTVSVEPPKYFWCQSGELYIHYYPDTNAKKLALEEIGKELGIQLIAEIIPKK